MALLLEVPRAKEFIALIKDRLKKKTAKHSVSVAELMASIAPETGIRLDQAVHAGLLHDLGKAMTDEELLDAAEQFGIAVSDLQRKRPKLLHGFVAAEMAKCELGIDDDEVYEAIAWHTTGHPNLGPVGLALYFADFAEPRREHPEAEIAREILERDGFNEALWYVSSQKLNYIQSKPFVDPMTNAFHEWLKANRS